MPVSIRVGYRRREDGTAEPICEPPFDEFFEHLRACAHLVHFRDEQCVAIGTMEEPVRIEGSVFPLAVMLMLERTAQEAVGVMKRIASELTAQYPFADIANFVLIEADGRLLLCLDKAFVETEPPVVKDDKRVHLEPPRLEYEGSRVRVIVTGQSKNHPLRVWIDHIICERVRDKILERIAEGAIPV